MSIKELSLAEGLKEHNQNTIEYFDHSNRLSKKNYKTLFEDIVKVIHYLNRQMLPKRARIGSICRNHYEFIVLDLACLLGGFHFVSFHYEEFKDKASEVFEQYELLFLVVDDAVTISSPVQSNIIFHKDIITVLESTEIPGVVLPSEFEKDEFYTTIFTSGSTGTPKGLKVKYRTINHFVQNCIQRFHINNTDKTILFLPLSQYSSRCYVYSAIITGFNLSICQPDKLGYALKYFKPTLFQAVPYFFESIYDNFQNQVNQSFWNNISFKIYSILTAISPIRKVLAPLARKLFQDIYYFFGGNIKFAVTGAAPIRQEVLVFFNRIGINIYESYGLVETGVITLNYPGCQKIGSVGKILPDKKVELDEDQQIIVESNELWGDSYEYASAEENKGLFCKKNSICTGDIGHIDKDGFLYLKGRLKELIILSNGTKVSPSLVEKDIGRSSLISQLAIFGDNQPYLSAVIVPVTENIKREDMQLEIDKINHSQSPSQKIKAFVLAEEAFSVENQLMKSSLKLDRKRIFEKYKQHFSLNEVSQ